jgi:hypothetical protein
VTDFYLGLLVAASAALALFATVTLSVLAWAVRWASRFSHVGADKSETGDLTGSIHIRGPQPVEQPK